MRREGGRERTGSGGEGGGQRYCERGRRRRRREGGRWGWGRGPRRNEPRWASGGGDGRAATGNWGMRRLPGKARRERMELGGREEGRKEGGSGGRCARPPGLCTERSTEPACAGRPHPAPWQRSWPTLERGPASLLDHSGPRRGLGWWVSLWVELQLLLYTHTPRSRAAPHGTERT
jgi:hypothetical protein